MKKLEKIFREHGNVFEMSIIDPEARIGKKYGLAGRHPSTKEIAEYLGESLDDFRPFFSEPEPSRCPLHNVPCDAWALVCPVCPYLKRK